VPPDGSHKELRPDGQQKGYIVLTDAERAKGFVQPVRRSYIHQKCSSLTIMGQSLAETYARNPWFYSGTFCCHCGSHFDLSEFVWVWGGPEESLDPLKWSHEKMDMVAARKKELK
jgi:hypothetical protein